MSQFEPIFFIFEPILFFSLYPTPAFLHQNDIPLRARAGSGGNRSANGPSPCSGNVISEQALEPLALKNHPATLLIY
jgi:hypothetical protein